MPPSAMKTPPVEKTALVGGEKIDHLSNFFCGGVASKGNDLVQEFGCILADGLAEAVFHVVLKRIIYRSGTDDIDPDFAAGDFFGHCAHEADQSVFGGGIGAYSGIGCDTDHTGSKDNAAAVVHLGKTVFAC